MAHLPSAAARGLTPLRAGERQYILHAKVGEGGFGTVYRGTLVGDSGFRRSVAIKTLRPPEQGDAALHEMMLHRLRDEARLLGRLHHRAIVRVTDVIDVPRGCLVIMDFIDGVDLKAAISRGPLPPRVAAELTLEIAAALEEAHEATDASTGKHLALVHRDIKPSNIRLTRSGEVRLLDFGIAYSTDPERESTTRQMFLGTPGYVAPERLDGIDTAAADIFSLGVVLIECLMGRRVGTLPVREAGFVAARGETLLALNGLDVSQGLTSLAAEMTAYEPAERPSAGDVVKRLQEMVAAQPGPWLRAWARDNIPVEGAPQTELDPAVLFGAPLADAPPVEATPVSASLAAEASAPPTAAAPVAKDGDVVDRLRGRRLAIAGIALVGGAVVAAWSIAGLREATPPPGGAPLPVVTAPPPPPRERAGPHDDGTASILAAPVVAPSGAFEAGPQSKGPKPDEPERTKPSPATQTPSAPKPAAGRSQASAARPPGTVSIDLRDGQLASAHAKDAWGTVFAIPGSVPPGSYRVQVRFAGQDDLIEPAFDLHVQSGADTVIQCTAMGRNCRRPSR